jgi:DNA-binding response OmpR family regulator
MQNEQIRVLIVDGALERDDRIDDILISAGFATRVVNDSVSAAGVLEVWRPSVAIVDLRFPSSEAQQFCSELAERPAADDVPIVLVAEGPNLLKATRVIPSGLVPTPVDADQLVATVIRVTRDTVRARGEPLGSR